VPAAYLLAGWFSLSSCSLVGSKDQRCKRWEEKYKTLGHHHGNCSRKAGSVVAAGGSSWGTPSASNPVRQQFIAALHPLAAPACSTRRRTRPPKSTLGPPRSSSRRRDPRRWRTAAPSPPLTPARGRSRRAGRPPRPGSARGGCARCRRGRRRAARRRRRRRPPRAGSPSTR